MSTMHRRTYFQGAQSIKLGVNSMKINTRLFNEDFIGVANNLPKAQDLLSKRKHPASQQTATRSHSEARSVARRSRLSKATSASVDPDEEDRRLDRLQKMRN